MTRLKVREMVYNSFENGMFPLPNQSIVLAKPEKSNSSQHLTTSEKSSSPEHSSTIFPLMKKYWERGLKSLTPKQMLQRLLVALAQVQVGNASKNLATEIHQIKYSLF